MAATYRLLIPVAALVVIGVPGRAAAQNASPIENGLIEVVAFAGYTSDGGGVTAGGGLQRAFSPRVLLAVEGTYLTGGERVVVQNADVGSHGVAVDVNGHYLFPYEWSDRSTPYVMAGVGYLRIGVSVRGPEARRRSTNFVGLNLGGGVRWNLNERWTLRPEVRIFFTDLSHVRGTLAFVYGFGR